jgi:hypothetical protein
MRNVDDHAGMVIGILLGKMAELETMLCFDYGNGEICT